MSQLAFPLLNVVILGSILIAAMLELRATPKLIRKEVRL